MSHTATKSQDNQTASNEPRNIVILGAGFAGQSAAHYYMKHIHPTLKRAGAPYRLILVDQSSHFWWHISAPRALVSAKAMPHEKTFVPIMQGFEQYRSDKDVIIFKQAQPVNLDTARRSVTIKAVSDSAPETAAAAHDEGPDADDGEDLANGGGATNPAHTETITYHALVIATGTQTPTPLTSFHGPHPRSQAALDAMNKRLSTARTVLIAGGGPVGVETAGEIGDALNGPKSSPITARVKITLVAGGSKMLPVLRASLSAKAEKLLNRVGVEVVYNAKVSRVDVPYDEAGQTTVHFDGGSGREPAKVDVYIPATGTRPNTGFLPRALLDARGHVRTNPGTLRVNDAGPRVYCLGDAGAYTRGGVLDLFAATPVMGRSLSADLGPAAAENGKAAAGGKPFKTDTSESQIVPVGRAKGVGAFKGFRMPSMAISIIKGKDYMIGTMRDVTWGNKYTKA